MVREIAERSRKDGRRKNSHHSTVNCPHGTADFSQSLESQLSAGLERSRVLCMSANAFGSDRAQLVRPAEASSRRRKSGTFRFRDPLNKERRFLPLRLDDAPGEGFKRHWPPLIKMDAAVRKKIDQLFNHR